MHKFVTYRHFAIPMKFQIIILLVHTPSTSIDISPIILLEDPTGSHHVRYRHVTYMTTRVASIPPNRTNLSCAARLSVNLITVLDIPRVLARSSIRRRAPFSTPRWSRRFVRTEFPMSSRLSMPR